MNKFEKKFFKILDEEYDDEIDRMNPSDLDPSAEMSDFADDMERPNAVDQAEIHRQRLVQASEWSNNVSDFVDGMIGNQPNALVQELKRMDDNEGVDTTEGVRKEISKIVGDLGKLSKLLLNVPNDISDAISKKAKDNSDF